MALTTVDNSSGYQAGANIVSSVTGGVSSDTDNNGFWSLDKCKRAYTTFRDSKSLEILYQHQVAARLIDLCVKHPAPIRGNRERTVGAIHHLYVAGELPDGGQLIIPKIVELNCRSGRTRVLRSHFKADTMIR